MPGVRDMMDGKVIAGQGDLYLSVSAPDKKYSIHPSCPHFHCDIASRPRSSICNLLETVSTYSDLIACLHGGLTVPNGSDRCQPIDSHWQELYVAADRFAYLDFAVFICDRYIDLTQCVYVLYADPIKKKGRQGHHCSQLFTALHLSGAGTVAARSEVCTLGSVNFVVFFGYKYKSICEILLFVYVCLFVRLFLNDFNVPVAYFPNFAEIVSRVAGFRKRKGLIARSIFGHTVFQSTVLYRGKGNYTLAYSLNIFQFVKYLSVHTSQYMASNSFIINELVYQPYIVTNCSIAVSFILGMNVNQQYLT